MIFFMNFFCKYVGYEFMVNFEESLDDVLVGDQDYKEVFVIFWCDFFVVIVEISDLWVLEVFDKFDVVFVLQFYFFCEDGFDFCICLKCGIGQLYFKILCIGGFVGCGNYLECCYICLLNGDFDDMGDVIFGQDEYENDIFLCKGCFGFYVQCGEIIEENKKLDWFFLFKGWDVVVMDLEKVFMFLFLFCVIGLYFEGGEIILNFGCFGFYVMY